MGLYRLISAIYLHGVNMLALLKIAGRIYGNKTALVDENDTLSYAQLLSESERLAIVLKESYQVKKDQKVGFLCKNHASFIKSIFAVSQLGADIYLLNVEMSRIQFDYLLEHHDFDLIIYDAELSCFIEESSYHKEKILSYHEDFPAINNSLRASVNGNQILKRSSSSKMVLLTGGTTGNSKVASHQPSIFNYVHPFLSLLTRLQLIKYNTAYIATPIYHGYGVAVLLLFIALGKKVVIHKGFDAKKACHLIHEHRVEVVTVVPLMLQKMLKEKVEDLRSISCIASGGAALNPKLVQETSSKLGDVLYNLYGTSEAGLNIIATPEDLTYSANTVGRRIKGVQIKIVDEQKNEVEAGRVGQLFIKNKGAMRDGNHSWIETGDLGYRDSNGYYFLSGRVDDMIVSAGENVYPVDIEQVLITHPQVEAVAVIGVYDEGFGQRLKAFVLPVQHATLTKEEMMEWLHPRVARFQLPKEITFVDQMPYTHLGKLDKKQLKAKH